MLSLTDRIDRLISALHAVKKDVRHLERQQPTLDPRDVAASRGDADPFSRVFGRRRGLYFRKRLEDIENSAESITSELKRLRG